jgi:GTP pyrophosphokinase
MSRSNPENAPADVEQADIVDTARQFVDALAQKEGLSAAITEGREIAAIVESLGLSNKHLAAVHLYPLVRGQFIDENTLNNNGFSSISRIVIDLQQLGRFSLPPDWRPGEALAGKQAEALRKMLLAVVSDVRLVLVRIAEQLYRMRHAKTATIEEQQALAIETREIYAALASRLGVWQLKWELEDLAFRYLDPDTYRSIAKALNEKRDDREHFIKLVEAKLHEELLAQGVKAEISGRPKHIYSIWRKMQHKGIGFSQVYDIRAVRVLVPEVKDCYAALGIVHGLWRNIPNEFDDYIANPKENGYRSLHTAVIGPEGKILEVQIRTHTMDEEAELGVCAHWRYKGSEREGGLASSYEEKIAWLRQVLDWHEETGDIHSLAEQFSSDMAQDRVYVFTPEGDVVNLAQGATPLDFAYHVHTEVGHSCRGAKVNGSIVPLTYQLQTGQQVQILTGREAAPRRDWLQSGLGYLKTSRARAKAQHWFKAQAREENVDAGRHLLEREFRRLALTSIDYKRVAHKVQQSTVEEMFAAVGAGDISAAQVLNAAQELITDTGPDEAPAIKLRKSTRRGDLSKSAAARTNSVQVQGIGNLLSHIAGCCKPLPGDGITGFITQGRGVSVHRRDCRRLLHLQMTSPERIIEVNWGGEGKAGYEVDIAIEAYDRSGLLRDITELLALAHINVLAVNTLTNRKHNMAAIRLTIEVPDLTALGKLLERISRLNNVASAVRLSEGGVERAS